MLARDAADETGVVDLNVPGDHGIVIERPPDWLRALLS
jgi:hypothetical protein